MHIPRAVAAATAASAGHRFAVYYDQWHPSSITKAQTANITHVITSFAASTLFNSDPPQAYQPFVTVDQLRPLFDEGTQFCVAIGGWGDTSGFSIAQKDEASRKTFASAVAKTLNDHSYDCIDIDWEYPGGNGEDYRQNPSMYTRPEEYEGKTDEIANFALLLKEIKSAVGERELTIAAPGREGDLIAYTAEQVPIINEIVDAVNVMTYDLMNRRDATTNHHTSVKGSLATIDKYIELGFDPEKLVLGFAFYAKYFETEGECAQPVGCKTALLEDANGVDTGRSGAVTFLEVPPVLASGQADQAEGGQWYWDPAESKFWTWDTPEFIAQKFEQIVKARGLGGVMAWSLGEDSSDFAYIKAIQTGLTTL